eukprot:gene9455-biopygen7804
MILANCFRYHGESKQCVRTTFFKMIDLGASAASDVIGAAIKSYLEESGLSLNKLIAMGVDGCSTMVGIHNSVSTQLKALVPGIVMFKCVCHSLQLAASKAAEVMPDCQLIAHFDFMVTESYNWFSFSHSTKRLIEYRELHKAITCEIADPDSSSPAFDA